MISLKEYISKNIKHLSESLICEEDTMSASVTKVNGVTVTYSAKADITVQVPTSFSEDDMQIYLDDACLNKMPASSDSIKKIWGANADNVSDAYFEYSKFEVSSSAPVKVDIEYNSRMGGAKAEDFVYYTLKELKYIIKFDSFDLENVSDTDIDKKLLDIFKACESNAVNKYPIEIALDKREGVTHE